MSAARSARVWAGLSIALACASVPAGIAAFPASMQETTVLIGVVTDGNGAPLANAMVVAVGIGSDVSTTSGQFRIPIARERVGTRVTLRVSKSGWVASNPAALVITVPRDPVQNPVRITLRRRVAAALASARPVPPPPPPPPPPRLPGLRLEVQDLRQVRTQVGPPPCSRDSASIAIRSR